MSGCRALLSLECQNNKLTTLNVAGRIALQDLVCNNNNITDVALLEYLKDRFGEQYILPQNSASNNVGPGNVVNNPVSTPGVTAPAKMSIAKLKIGKRYVKVTWKKPAASQGVSGYEIRYKAKKAKKWKTKKVAAKATSITIKKLKKGKRYQFKLRPYKAVQGKKYCAPWSKTKTSKKVK
ncbi:MAG: fibronectin type III domain-containing protein [Clostridiales Family XIII bacterium]|jgi:hypothetical protein|nr:fibronectin type III domain-containing protein [Clostridiales Family XIII bacterium]